VRWLAFCLFENGTQDGLCEGALSTSGGVKETKQCKCNKSVGGQWSNDSRRVGLFEGRSVLEEMGKSGQGCACPGVVVRVRERDR
jgi:hypothetical protein